MPGWLYNVSMCRMSLASPSCLCSSYKAVLDTFDLIFSDILVFLLWFFIVPIIEIGEGDVLQLWRMYTCGSALILCL
jgi:hypothetical protein